MAFATYPQRLAQWGRSEIGLITVLLVGAVLRLWNLQRDGVGIEYYAAGVLSMMQSLHNFFFVSFDPAGFVSVDKPPLALWFQVTSAELFGFSGPAVILPQVIEGLAAIILLYWLVARRFSKTAGNLAAAILAIMPVSVAVDRSSNTDSCLVLALLLVAAATILAVERASFKWLLAAMLAIGIGFNVKMAAALGIVPACCLAYLLAGIGQWRSRIAQLALGGVVAMAIAFSWFIAFDLVAPDARPYAGSTTDNSMLQMVFVQYGVDRFVPRAGREQYGNRGQARNAGGIPGNFGAAGQTTGAGGPGNGAGASGPGNSAAAGGLGADRIPIGPFRLATPRLGGQVSWFFPLAVFGAFSLGVGRRLPRTPKALDLVVWSGWALAYGVVFSFAGGIFHSYYVVAMAPPVAALSGIALVALWQRYRAGGPRAWLLPAALGVTGIWQAVLEYRAVGWRFDSWLGWLLVLMIAGALAGAAGLILADRRNRRRLAPAALALGFTATALAPLAWSLSTVFGDSNVSFPAADIALLGPPPDPATQPVARRNRNEHVDNSRLIAFLQDNRGNAQFLLATQTATQAAPIILATQAPVMAVGGYSGNDPILTPDALAAYVADGRLRYFLLRDRVRGAGAAGGAPGGQANAAGANGAPPPNAQARLIADWVKAYGQPVDPALWRGENPRPVEAGRAAAQETLYDLRSPEALND